MVGAGVMDVSPHSKRQTSHFSWILPLGFEREIGAGSKVRLDPQVHISYRIKTLGIRVLADPDRPRSFKTCFVAVGAVRPFWNTTSPVAPVRDGILPIK